jgi:hypothetical protein
VLILIPKIVILGEIRRITREFSRPIKTREKLHPRETKKKTEENTKENQRAKKDRA